MADTERRCALRKSLVASIAAVPPIRPEGQGVWLSLERLRQLPLAPSDHLQVLQEALEAAAGSGIPLPLLGELAELRYRCCEQAFRERAWSVAIEHHDALLELVSHLASQAPDQSDDFWTRYGELLALLTGAVHAVVMPQCPDPPPRQERAELAWQLAQRLNHAATLPPQPPDWLPVLEQQLVQQGAFLWRELLDEGQATDALPTTRLRRRALELLLRLHQLLDPAPDWIGVKAGELVEQQIQEVLAQDPPEALALEQLLSDLERLPVAEVNLYTKTHIAYKFIL